MQRKEFIKTCGLIMLGGVFLPSLSSCSAGRFIKSSYDNNTIIVNKEDILESEMFVMIETSYFSTPIMIARNNDGFIAFLLKCTHSGCELDVFLNKLVCPCHGSEFNLKGEVTHHPALTNLKSFPAKWDDKNIYVDIKG